MRSVKIINLPSRCGCGKGHRSRLDGLCQNCRCKRGVCKFNAFWVEVEAKDVHEKDWEFSLLRAKHFGAVYVIED